MNEYKNKEMNGWITNRLKNIMDKWMNNLTWVVQLTQADFHEPDPHELLKLINQSINQSINQFNNLKNHSTIKSLVSTK